MTDREVRITELKAKLGTVHETPMTSKRIDQFMAMTDTEYKMHIINSRAATVGRMAAQLKRI